MTAFFTKAPLLQWKQKKDNPRPDDTSAYMNRSRPITVLNFAGGTGQAQSILKICAAIDETSRAYAEARERLWDKIQAAPANTLIYLLSYHDPPASWENDEEYKANRDNADPAQFYSPQRLADLASSRVRLFDLSRNPKSQGGEPNELGGLAAKHNRL